MAEQADLKKQTASAEDLHPDTAPEHATKPKIRWTEKQEEAISARKGTILVSAAAGSGKTAVLVERVIQRLTDEADPCNANELLIVTFTKAATAEMRSRLSGAISAALEKDPENTHLQRQQLLLPSAQICTIDSFCTTLVREHFDDPKISVSPDFRMLEESEAKFLKQAAVTATVEECYETEKEEFKTLVELLFSGRDDAKIEETVLKLYEYSRAYPSPKKWLEDSLASYDETIPLRKSKIFAELLCSLSSAVSYAYALAEQSLKELLLNAETAVSKAAAILTQEKALLEQLQQCLEASDLDGVRERVQNYQPETWNSGGKAIKDLDAIKKSKASRDAIKDILQKSLPKLLFSTEEDYKEDCRTLKPLAKALVETVFLFSEKYDALKRAENALDFSDVELFALRLLVKDPDTGDMSRTLLAKELGLQFRELLIDEYQDTNKAQDAIFSALSREETNLFMVGDVKQSIYRFRKAMPQLFMERRNRYPLYDRTHPAYPASIILGQNFRSREGITQSVNFVFRQLMGKQIGEIEYNDEEALVYSADYAPVSRPETEFFFLEKEETLIPEEKEGKLIAGYILDRMQEDSSLHFKDFALLLRKQKGTAPIYEKALREAGIPVYTTGSGNLLDFPDIRTILSFLRIIDNPLQDIPLASALLSPLFGFSEDDLAALRADCRVGSLYAALLQKSKEDEDSPTELSSRCKKVLEALGYYRRLSVSLPCAALLQQIYEDTAYLSIVSAKRGGTQREAVLKQFLTLAEQYDTYRLQGLSGFLRYLDGLEENAQELEPISTLSESSDVVRIMSIHKSKGLQFRICILADLGSSFNTRENNDSVILHPDLGIGLKGRDFSTGYPYPTLIHTAIQQANNRADLSENLRVLYVAMTRAKEHLVLVGTNKTRSSTENYIGKWALPLKETLPIDPYAVSTGNSFLDWITLAFLRRPELAPLRTSLPYDLPTVKSDFNMNFRFYESSALLSMPEKTEHRLPKPNPEQTAEIKHRLSYRYPFEKLATTLSKRAASALQEGSFDTRYFAKSKPEFLSKSGLTPSERGTCLHKFMQYADFQTAERNPQEALDRLVEQAFLTETEVAAIETEVISGFFKSALYRRIKQSPALYREKKFAILEKAGTLDPSLPEALGEEKVMIQGIVDCAFEEDGKLVILDYKTDRVTTPEQLTERYKDQLQTYCKALSRCMGKEVKEAYLFSFALGKEIKVE